MQDEETIKGCAIGFALLIFLCLLPFGCYGSKIVEYEYATGIIIEKVFKPHESHVNVGVTTGGDVAVTPSSSPEIWTVIATIAGEPWPVKVDKNAWIAMKRGDSVQLSRGVRRWFGKTEWKAE